VSRPIRTWRIEVARDANQLLSETQAAVLEGSTAISELDEDDAARTLLAVLGVALVPCCSEDALPCAECDAQMRGDEIDKAVHETLLRQESGLR